MIYDDSRRIDEQLTAFAETELAYDTNRNYREGFDTAWDIATCCNKYSIWHLQGDKMPEDDDCVLVYTGSNHIRIAWFNEQYGWCLQGSVCRLQEDVVCWAELPELPDGIDNDRGGEQYDG